MRSHIADRVVFPMFRPCCSVVFVLGTPMGTPSGDFVWQTILGQPWSAVGDLGRLGRRDARLPPRRLASSLAALAVGPAAITLTCPPIPRGDRLRLGPQPTPGGPGIALCGG